MSKFSRMLKPIYSLPPRYDADAEWRRITNRVVGRFARGNIAAQNGRILTKDDQDRQHERARTIVTKWRERKKSSAR